jgi:protein-S-isoprenylcysteine O-methyltransferase Ste14
MAKIGEHKRKHPAAHKPRTLILPPAPYAAAIVVGWWLDRNFLQISLDVGQATTTVAWLIIAAGLCLMLWAALQLYLHRTTINPYAGADSLCKKCPFCFSRNPIYLADWIILLGFSLWLKTLWPIVLSPIVWWMIHYGVIRHEEEHLEAKFGDDYRNYKATVRRWI